MIDQPGETLNYSSGHDEFLTAQLAGAALAFNGALQAARDAGLTVDYAHRFEGISVTSVRRSISLWPLPGDAQ